MRVSVSTRAEAGTRVVDVGGEVDVHTSPSVRDALTAEIDAGRRNVVVNLDGVEFLDSTGLGVLVAAHRALADSGGSLHIVCSKERVLRLFDITGLREVLSLHGSLAEALAAAGPRDEGPTAG